MQTVVTMMVELVRVMRRSFFTQHRGSERTMEETVGAAYFTVGGRILGLSTEA
jgi:hypothetical protein